MSSRARPLALVVALAAAVPAHAERKLTLKTLSGSRDTVYSPEMFVGAGAVGLAPRAGSTMSIEEVLKLARLAPTPEAEVRVLVAGATSAKSVDDAIRLARATRSDKNADQILKRAEG